MATSVPLLKFKGAVKIHLADSTVQEEFKDAMKDQTSDLLAFRKKPADDDYKKKPAKVIPTEPMFAEKNKKKKSQAVKEPLEEKAVELPTPKMLVKYEKDLQIYGIEVLGSEYENPYGDKALAPVYPLQTRMGFQKQILKVFQRFMKPIENIGKEPDFDACKKMSLTAQQQVEMYEYQKFVREYIRQASPYRGILVYHGLGSGKTCTAIAAAEALLSVSRKKIIIMTPSSLRDNFIREMTFCGFRHFRLQNYWVQLDSSIPLLNLFAREVLGLPKEYLVKGPAIWVPDFSQPEPNFNTLTSEERQQVTQQVIQQIRSRVRFINYNGISASRLKEIACAEPSSSLYRLFDNSVIVIDEIHNLTRLIQGNIEPYIKQLPGMKRKIAFEPIEPGDWVPTLCKKHVDPTQKALTNYHRGYLFYRLLATARNSKIIGLSGTPLINFPEELGILVNLLGGYINTVNFIIKEGTPQNKAAVEKVLRNNSFIDFEEVNILGSSLSVLFTLLPEGMKKVLDKDGTLGVQQLPPDETSPTIQEITETIRATLKLTFSKEPEFKSEPLLPAVGEDFRQTFLEDNGSDLKNVVVLRKRLQGLISYYRGSKKELMPLVTKDEVVYVPFTPFAQKAYTDVRSAEVKAVQKKQKKKGGLQGIGSKAQDLWAQIYDLSTGQKSNSYRMSSRQACNFAFPETIARPRPRTTNEVDIDVSTDKGEIFDDNELGGFKPPAAFGEVEGNQQVEIPLTPDMEAGEDDVEKARQEDEDIDELARQGAILEAREKGDDDLADELEDEGSPDTIDELPPSPGEGAVLDPVGPGKKNLSEVNALAAQRQKELAECQQGRLAGEPYPNATRRAKNCLEKFVGSKLRLYPMGKKTITEFKAGTAPDKNLLMKYSPKYAAILQNILSAPGSSLVYSQFLDMEGIGIFQIALRKNEFDSIQFEGDYKSGFSFSASTIESFQKRPTRFRYLTFTGSEHPTLRSMALRVFNSKYSEDAEGKGSFIELPPEMSKILVDAGFKGNTLGEICRVFCITSAGAEGLSLRNVRRVHIMEPYWNHVRTDQVKGRAVRICSHVDLEYSEIPEENQRTVEVYTYCSIINPETLLHPEGTPDFLPIDQTILNEDGISEKEAKAEGFPIPMGARDYVLTSDEYLLALSQKKKKVLENIQNVMKTSAVDCELNVFDNEDDGLGCVRIGGNPEQYAFHPNLQKDIQLTAIKFKAGEVEKPVEPSAEPGATVPVAPKATAVKARKISYGGKTFLAVPVTEKASGIVLSYDLYDMNDIYRTKRLGTTQADIAGNPTADIVLV
jgi:hypothetical protein